MRPMMLRSNHLQTRAFASKAKGDGGGFNLYDTVMKTNSRYVLFVVTGAAVGEFMFGAVGDLIWDLNNRGVCIV